MDIPCTYILCKYIYKINLNFWYCQIAFWRSCNKLWVTSTLKRTGSQAEWPGSGREVITGVAPGGGGGPPEITDLPPPPFMGKPHLLEVSIVFRFPPSSKWLGDTSSLCRNEVGGCRAGLPSQDSLRHSLELGRGHLAVGLSANTIPTSLHQNSY